MNLGIQTKYALEQNLNRKIIWINVFSQHSLRFTEQNHRPLNLPLRIKFKTSQIYDVFHMHIMIINFLYLLLSKKKMTYLYSADKGNFLFCIYLKAIMFSIRYIYQPQLYKKTM